MDTKEKIIQSARTLFVKQSIDGTSTSQITDDVGISSGALFVHFPSKQDLVDAVYLKGKETLIKALEGSITSDASVRENMFTIFERSVEYYLKHYDEFLFQDMVSMSGGVSKKTLRKGQQEISDFFDFIQSGIDEGEIKNVDVQLIKSTIWSQLSTILRFMKAHKKKDFSQEYFGLIWDAIKR